MMEPGKLGLCLMGLIAQIIAVFCFASVFLSPNTTEKQPENLHKSGSGPAPLGPPPLAERSTMDNVKCAIQHFEREGYLSQEAITNSEGEDLQILYKVIRDDNEVWRAEGALIYPNGESSTFSAGMIYGEGTWTKNSPKTLNRRGNRRDVLITTVLDEEEFKSIAKDNDYVIPVGVASNADRESRDFNLSLAYARAYNLGVAVRILRWQPADRIVPNTLGYAASKASTPAEELSQRPVVLIGAKARRDVVVSDVTFAAVKIAPQDRVIASKYLFSNNQPEESNPIYDHSDYLNVSDFPLTEKSDDYQYRKQILPAVKQDDKEETSCDEQ